jgi:hypothetical protein
MILKRGRDQPDLSEGCGPLLKVLQILGDKQIVTHDSWARRDPTLLGWQIINLPEIKDVRRAALRRKHFIPR